MDSRGNQKPQLLPSPGPSSPSTIEATSTSSLPLPRFRPLKPGSQKEVAFINYVDSKILQINRRYAKKFSSDRDEADEEARGYDDFQDVVEDLEHVFDAVWVSGTPTLQIPYMLSLAGIIADYLPAFPFVEDPTTRIVDKLDQAFAALLGQVTHSATSVATNDNRHLVSVTDRVRIRSVIEGTRIVAVDVATKGAASTDVLDVSESFMETDYEESITAADGSRSEKDVLHMSISKMYERSLSILGDSLG